MEERASLLQLEPDELAGGGEPHELTPLSLREACSRVGHFFDLWHTNPGVLVHILQQSSRSAAQHPLRGLFFPVMPLPDPGAQGVPTTVSSQFVLGQQVQVRLTDTTKANIATHYPKRSGDKFRDDTKEYEAATIVATNADGSYTVEWDAGYETDLVHNAENIQRTEDGFDVGNAVAYVLKSMGYSADIQWTSVVVLLLSAACILCLPQLLAHAFAKDPCTWDQDTLLMTALCSTHETTLAKNGGFVVGAVCLALSFACAYVVLPCIYAAATTCFPVTSKRTRQVFQTAFLDQIRVFGLPTVYGPVEEVIVVLFIAANISGICMTVLTLDASLVPLTTLLATQFLRAMNATFGEKPGLKAVRRRYIINLLEERLKAAKVDMNIEQLRHEVDCLLELPGNSGVVQLSLGVTILVAGIFQVEQPDSVRTRTFIIERSFALYKHKIYEPPTLTKKHDVVVDVFCGTCKVPSLTLVGERWCAQGQPLAWHLGVKPANVRQFEIELQGLGMATGAGCFTWRAFDGNPAALEAADPSRLLGHSSSLAANHMDLSTSLRDLCNATSIRDDPELVVPFIRAGADVNVAVPPNNITPVYSASMSGKSETVRTLIKARADVNKAESSRGRSPLHVTAQFGNEATAQLLVQARADVDALMHGSDSPLHAASYHGNTEVARVLVEARANLEHQESNLLCSPLASASATGHAEIVKCLVEARANIDQQAHTGSSPLSIAIYCGHLDTARILIENGADTTLKDNYGDSALEQQGSEALRIREEVVQLVEERKRQEQKKNDSELAQGSLPPQRSAARWPLRR